ncbi:hypothetical protein Pst134EB_021533 [Puccinia striiformis f. sp. tritici]|nr:hypothetical protein Pst134EB_021533 [Puccinia striiformis f. sp. tritici]
MDPWSSNDWLEPAPSSATPQLDLDLQPRNESANPNQSAWPVPDLSLPDWDNPSPPRTRLPSPAIEATDSPQPEFPVKLPVVENLAIDTHTSSPTSSDQSVFKTPNQSPVIERPSILSEPACSDPSSITSSLPGPLTPTDHHSHISTQPVTDTDPDLDRWGTFTHTDLPPISSVIPFVDPDPPSFPRSSPTQSGWDSHSNLGGWDDGHNTVDPCPPPRQDEDDQPQFERGWSPTQFSEDDHPNVTSGGAWDQSASQETDETSSTALDLDSAPSDGTELPSTHGQPPRNPSIQTSAAGTFQNSATVEAIQTAASKTAQVATSVLQSTNSTKRWFSSSGTQSSTTTSSLTAVKSINPDDKLSWGDFAAAEASQPPHDPESDAPGMSDSQKIAQQQEKDKQKKRTSFFGFWASKSPPPANTPTSPPQKIASGPSTLPPLGITDPSISSSNPTKDSASSADTPSTAWPAPSPASASPQPDPAPSAISRLFGRLGSRSNTAATGTSTTDDQSEITAASTELSANDIKFLDQIKTVPLEPKTVPYDDFPIAKNTTTQTKRISKHATTPSQAGLFDFLSEDSLTPKATSPYTSQEVTSSNSLGLTKSGDPFEFLHSLSRTSSSQKRIPSDPSTSSTRATFSPPSGSIPIYSNFAPSPSRSNSATIHPERKSSGDDLDELFSHFQSPEISHQSKTLWPSAPRQNSSAPRGFQRTSATKSTAPTGQTQVRMSSTSNLQRDSHSYSLSSSSISSKVPILAPPPPPPPSSSPRPHTSTPIPLLPAPQNNKVVQNLTSPQSITSFNSFRPPSQNVNTNNNLPPSSSFATTIFPSIPPPPPPSTTSPHPNQSTIKPILPPPLTLSSVPLPPPPAAGGGGGGGGLSKEDLSFFDSLI